MIYICKTAHCRTGKTHIFRTVYDYQPGDIVYPWHLQSQYPGHAENRHRVIACVPLDKLTREQLNRLEREEGVQ